MESQVDSTERRPPATQCLERRCARFPRCKNDAAGGRTAQRLGYRRAELKLIDRLALNE